MINFPEGKIDLGVRTIRIASARIDLDALAEHGLIGKRKDAGNGVPYLYVETLAEGMRFGVSISSGENKIKSLVLHWLDGPCTGKGWDGVSDELLREEYRLLLKFVQKNGGGRPDSKQEGQSMWRFKWGQVVVSCQRRDFVTAIFMTPRGGHKI